MARKSRLRSTFWLDFGDVSRRLAVEIDGSIGHATVSGVQRDYRRDTVLSGVFVVLRFSATEVRKDPRAVAHQVRRRVVETPPIVGPFVTSRGLRVVPTTDGVDIYDPGL